MLSLPVIRDVHVPVWVFICAFVYLSILFVVLKIFQHNRDPFDEQ